jgi:hypothetical protein
MRLLLNAPSNKVTVVVHFMFSVKFGRMLDTGGKRALNKPEESIFVSRSKCMSKLWSNQFLR